jgi:hypothetical protein
MPRFAPLFLVALAAALLAPACSSSGGSGIYADKCALACAPPSSGPCFQQEPAECESQCAALTEGLSATCVQCIVENSGWKGIECPANCTDCCPCHFSPGPGDNACESGTGCSCGAADETCTGFELAKSTGSECAAACAVK